MIQTKPWQLLLLILIPAFSNAQEAFLSRPSPAAIVSVKYKDTYVKITYGQPRKRGRVIFGELVPYGEVWRTGANEATEITLTKDVIVQGTILKAGTYSLFTIPEKDFWTIIFNKDVGLWGSYNYNQKQDVFRIKAPVATTDSEVYEVFTIQFEHRNNMANLLLSWDKTLVSIPLQFFEPK
jgi:hypothetical protein